MTDMFAPPFIFLWAAVLCALLPSRGRAILLLVTPALALLSLLSYSHGQHVTLNVVGFELAFMRVDKLSIIFGIIFCICLLYTSPSPRDRTRSRMPSSA